MKKIRLLLAVMGILLLSGGHLWAGIPADKYRLSVTQTIPEIMGELTNFSLRDRLDTLTGKYLRVDAEPIALPASQNQTVQGNPIGFEFPFAGNIVTTFGISGNGHIYLGDEDSLTINYGIAPNQNDSNIMMALPRLLKWSQVQNLVISADNQTEIGFLSSEVSEEKLLLIRFKNLILSAENETYRWSYDVVLFQNGNIAVHFVDTELPETTSSESFGFSFGMKSLTSLVSFSDWEGAMATGVLNPLPFNESNTGATLAFLYPLDCERPTGTTLAVKITKQLSRSIAVDVDVEGAHDGFIAFFADADQIAERPEDGKMYLKPDDYFSEPDSIGNYPILIYSNSEKKFSVTNLLPEKDYYVYAFPYNDRCIGGPLYTAEPLIRTISTFKAPPAVTVSETTENSIALEFDQPSESEILVGIARRDYGAPDRVLPLSEKNYSEGDTLYYDPSTMNMNGNKGPYLIRVGYAGTVSGQHLRLENLDPATPYYLYIWDKTGDKAYMTEYTPVNAHTVGHTPLTFDFSTARILGAPDSYLPAGWSSSEGMNIDFSTQMVVIGGMFAPQPSDVDKVRALVSDMRAKDGSTKGIGDLISPAFVADNPSLGISYRVQMATSSWTGSSVAYPSTTDTFELWFRTDQAADWTRADMTTSETFPEAYEEDNYVTLKTRIDVPEGATVQLRFVVKGQASTAMGGRKISLHSMYIEPALSCGYPTNIRVNDSLTTHRTIALNWDDENRPAASSFIYRYRIQDSDMWSAYYVATRNNGCLIEPLTPYTAYEIDIRSVCRSVDTSLVRTIEASTMYALPYTQSLTNIAEFPAGMDAWIGDLKGNEYVERQRDGGFSVGKTADAQNTTVGCGLGGASSANWLILPPFCLEDQAAPSQYTFLYKLYTQSDAGELEEYSDKDDVRVLVLLSPDGRFSSAEIIDTLKVENLKAQYQKYTIDLSSRIRQVHIALAVKVTDIKQADLRSYFVIDSLQALYTDEIPCLSVENVIQHGLSVNSVTLEWTGYSLEYGIYYENTATGKIDTVYTDQTSYTLTGLEPGTLYLYRIQSFCQEGHRSPGPVVGGEAYFFTTGDICRMPENFSVIGTTWESVTMTGHSESRKLIHIWAKDTVNYDYINYHLEGWGATRDTFTVSGLNAQLNMTYKVAIRSVCSTSVGDSSAWTAPIEFTTDKPECGAPADLKSTVTETSADLSWTAGKNNDYFRLMYRKISDPVYDTTKVEALQYRLSGLERQTSYVWQLEGVCYDAFVSDIVSDDFTTLGTGNEGSWGNTIIVRAENGRISILNPNGHRIDRVDVFDAGGKILYGENLRTTGNVLLPALDTTSRLALVRIISGKDASIYKVIVL